MTATTALTAQNTKGVYDIHHVPVAFLRKQIDAVIEDVGVDVVKTGPAFRSSPILCPIYAPYKITLSQGVITDVMCSGMLASAESIETIASALEAHDVSTLVIDPVCFLRLSPPP